MFTRKWKEKLFIEILPPYLSEAITEISRIQEQSNENWKIEPEKSVPFAEKETNPKERKKDYRKKNSIN